MKIAGDHAGHPLHLEIKFLSSLSCPLNKMRWAGARLCFIGFITFGVLSGVGLYLLAPLFSYYFFGTLRFWKYAHLGPRLIVYAYAMAFRYLKGEFTPSSHDHAGPDAGSDQPCLGKRRLLRGLWKVLQENPLPPSGRGSSTVHGIQFLLLALFQLRPVPFDPGGHPSL